MSACGFKVKYQPQSSQPNDKEICECKRKPYAVHITAPLSPFHSCYRHSFCSYHPQNYPYIPHIRNRHQTPSLISSSLPSLLFWQEFSLMVKNFVATLLASSNCSSSWLKQSLPTPAIQYFSRIALIKNFSFRWIRNLTISGLSYRVISLIQACTVRYPHGYLCIHQCPQV